MEKKKRYQLLAAGLAVALAASVGYLIWRDQSYRRGFQQYQSALEVAALPSSQLEEAAPAVTEEAEPGWELPEELLDILSQVDLEALRQRNSDVTGWIVIPGTEVSYPVLQGEDNSYYLNHTWTGVESLVGSIFMECQNDPSLEGYNTILYGHRMRNGSMFGSLREYAGEEYWRAHPVIYLVSGGGVYAYDVFAAYESGVREVVYRLDVDQDPALREELVDFALSSSVISTGVTPEPGERVLTLSTCTGRGYSTRWVVQGVLRAQAEL